MELCDADLSNLDPARARDLVVRCFWNAQRETFSRLSQQAGRPPTDDELRRTVEGAVRLAFRETKGEFEQPTRAALMAAVENLAAKSEAMGTPRDIIAHHRGQLARLFAALPG